MAKERILITVKTYPTLSKKYGETVCTAGIREDGSWVRLYPVPFRRLDETEQYSKFDWVELNLIRQTSDCRPESHRPYDPKAMPVVGHIGTGDQWRERRKLMLETCTVYDRLETLCAGAKANKLSLAVFKPAKILDFVTEDRPALFHGHDAAVPRFFAESVADHRRIPCTVPQATGLVLMPPRQH